MDVQTLCVIHRETTGIIRPLPVSASTARELLRMKWRETVAADYDEAYEDDEETELLAPSFWTAQTMALAAL